MEAGNGMDRSCPKQKHDVATGRAMNHNELSAGRRQGGCGEGGRFLLVENLKMKIT